MGIGVASHEDIVEMVCMEGGQVAVYRMPILMAMELRQDLQRAIERATRWEENAPEPPAPLPPDPNTGS